MKLILAIINHDDANTVTQALTKKGQTVIDIIREHSHSRKQMIPTTTEMSYGYYPSMPVEVVVGGATIFVVDIERFERV